MALLVGIDDTDSRAGGCTTALAARIAPLFPELEPEGAPRLVRLNPNVPWKTRGNGAVAVRFRGEMDLEEALGRVWRLVAAEARPEEGTSPGLVVARTPPSWRLYEAAVSRLVERTEAEEALAAVHARWRGGRGVIGAAAALAWPAARATWELIAYRDPARIGQPRAIDPQAVRNVERAFPSLFGSYDLDEDEVVCVPSSPCPVLWGLRAHAPDELDEAARTMGPEPPDRRTLFLTNQATDDHLRDGVVADARAYGSLRVRARVAAPPLERNGHAFLEVSDGTGSLRAAAYAPTRGFRRLVLRLAPQDDVTLCGGLHAGPDGRLTLGLEKLLLHEAVPRRLGNPLCAGCGRTMGSAGAAAGFRCRPCGTRSSAPRTGPADVATGWHEVPACARRHLARPMGRAPLPEPCPAVALAPAP